ncbi:MAG: BrnT family toxin [Methylococcales bacterium]|nr:BrnT family toxin [Methylococcales bacterium]
MASILDGATSCLLDPNALAYEDNDATGENRWVLLRVSHQARLLVVIYTVRGESIRLILARKPTTKEANNYA